MYPNWRHYLHVSSHINFPCLLVHLHKDKDALFCAEKSCLGKTCTPNSIKLRKKSKKKKIISGTAKKIEKVREIFPVVSETFVRIETDTLSLRFKEMCTHFALGYCIYFLMLAHCQI